MVVISFRNIAKKKYEQKRIDENTDAIVIIDGLLLKITVSECNEVKNVVLMRRSDIISVFFFLGEEAGGRQRRRTLL